jgi:UDP-glucose 4-epimerase
VSPLIWTIGAGGLLGSAIVRATRCPFAGGPVPWGDEAATARALAEQARSFASATEGGPWAVVWAAGRAATGSSVEETAPELRALTALVTALGQALPAGPGVLFVASSAGGVYAGSSGAPFDATSLPRPLSPYGELKLAQEQVAAELADRVSVVIGRFSNLYGPGQDLGKLQGLISRLALAAITKEPVNMFVSLDTMRDYLYVDDAAALTLDAIDQALHPSHSDEGGVRIRVLASGQPTSLGQLITVMQDITRTRIPIALGAHASASAQARDLRLIRTDEPRTRELIRTTLPAGAKRVHLDILERMQRAQAVGQGA